MAGARFLDPSSIPLRRQSGGNIWATLVQVTQAVTIVVVLSGLLLFFWPVIHQTHALQEQKAALSRQIIAAQEQQENLQLQTEQLNMARPGETIVRFDSYKSLGPPAPRTVTAQPSGAALDEP
jgi:hypothetical protein